MVLLARWLHNNVYNEILLFFTRGRKPSRPCFSSRGMWMDTVTATLRATVATNFNAASTRSSLRPILGAPWPTQRREPLKGRCIPGGGFIGQGSGRSYAAMDDRKDRRRDVGWDGLERVGTSWDDLGTGWDGLGTSWDALETFWAGLGTAWAGLGTSWDELGTSWDALGTC